MTALKKCLDFLNENVLTSSVYTCELKIKEIEEICLKRLSKTELGYYCSQLFQGKASLLSFLSKASTSQQHKVTRELVLNFLTNFIPRIGNFVKPYVRDILKICANAFQKDRYSKNKDKNLQIIKQLVSSKFDEKDKDLVPLLVKISLEELAKSASNTTATVRGHTLELLGVFARYVGDQVTQHGARWLDIMLRELKEEMVSQSNGELRIIEGALNGLHGLLFSFHQIISNDPNMKKEIHKYARMALQPQSDLSRFGVPIAAMKLLKDHASLFSTFLIQDYRSYYISLERWFEHNNNHLKHAAHMAMEAFFEQIAVSSEAGSVVQTKEMLLYFIKKFEVMIKSEELSSKQMSLAVQGYGLLASPCRKLLSAEDVKFMCAEMISRCDHIFLRPDTLDSERIHRLPTFIGALGNIVKQSNRSEDEGFQLSESSLRCLEQLCVLLVENYPRLHESFAHLCHRSLRSCMMAFVSCPDVLRRLQFCIGYQGLIRSCSCDVIFGNDREKLLIGEHVSSDLSPRDSDVIHDVINDARTITFSNYVPLWVALLKMNSNSTSLTDQRILLKTFTSAFVDAVIEIIEKLNLKTVDSSCEETGSLPVIILSQTDSLEAENLSDFKIFINLCDLCCEIFTSAMHYTELSSHIYKLSQTLVSYATRYPLVSGFYKLLSALMRLCDETGYFLSESSSLHASGSPFQRTDSQRDEAAVVQFLEKKQFVTLLQKFAIELSRRMKQFKDELLHSSLFFLLNLPTEISRGILQELVPIVKLACRVGNDYLPLAAGAINAIHRWKVTGDLLLRIIPHLEPLLHYSRDFVFNEKVGLKKTKKLKLLNEGDELSRRSIRFDVMRLIGSSGCQKGVLMGEKKEDQYDVAPCDNDISIQYAIPFRDIKPIVRLDLLLWRVIEIARTSSDRKAKISACELLHSATIYIIGWNAQRENAKQSCNIAPLYEKVFPALFALACDHDQVCRQIFGPLIKQIIHWFTKNLRRDNPTSTALLDTIMEGLIDKENSSLRDLSANSLREFLTWSVKQDSTNDGHNNAQLIFKRINSLALHPSPVCRLGAAAGFNALYRVFRENDRMVDDFSFELFVVFINSLSLSHYDDSSYGTSTLCVQVLSHLNRIISVKSEMLVKDSQRSKPRGFTHQCTLSGMVRWLFDQVGRPQTECRRQCITHFNQFITLLPYDEKSPLKWLDSLLKDKGVNYIVERFESGSDGLGIASHPVLSSFSSKFSIKSALNWLDLVLAALECNLWVFDGELLSPRQLLMGKHSSKLFESLNCFLTEVCNREADQIACLFQREDNTDTLCTPQEVKQFDELKSDVVRRVLQFVTYLLKSSLKDPSLVQILPPMLCGESGLPFLLVLALISPTRLGFDTVNSPALGEEISQLSKGAISLLLKLRHTHPELDDSFCRITVEQIKAYLKNYGFLDDVLPQPLGAGKTHLTGLNIQDLLRAYSCLHEIGLITEVLEGAELSRYASGNFATAIFDRVFSSVVQEEDGKLLARDLKRGVVELARNLLKFALDIGVPPDHVITCLTNCTAVASSDRSVTSSGNQEHCRLFLSTFSSQVFSHMCKFPGSYAPQICSSPTSGHILSGMLEHLACTREERKKYAQGLCSAVLEEWSTRMRTWWQGFDLQRVEMTMVILKKLLSLDATVFQRPNSAECKSLFEMYTALLSASKLGLSFKNQILDLLPFFSLAKEHWKLVVEGLESMAASHFPLSSREFNTTSSSYCTYSNALRKILSALEACGDTALLKLIASVVCREEDHIMLEEIQASLQRAVLKMQPHQQTSSLVLLYQLYQDLSYPITFRSQCVTRMLVAFATYCDVTALIEFFKDCVTDVMELVRDDVIQCSMSVLREKLTLKSCGYQIMELMFTLLTNQQVQPTSVIGHSFARSQSQDSLLKSFMKSANRDKSFVIPEGDLREQGRLFHCNVFNALIAAVVCTQKEVAWYKTFLFDDNPKRRQTFLDALLDHGRVYNFAVEMDEPLKRRKRFVAIRRQRDESGPAVSYMASVYASSLSEDVSAFDANVGRTIEEEGGSDQSHSSFSSSQGTELSLEVDELNEHECMAAMIGLLTHMEDNKIGFPSDSDDSKLPAFMTNMHRKLSSRDSKKNVRLFIAKLILNCASIFKKFASHWIAPLVSLYLAGDLDGNEINSMVCDLLATVLSWNSVAIPDDSMEGRELVQGVVEKLCREVNLRNRSIARHNLDLIKTVLECWGSRMKVGVDPSIVYEMCGRDDQLSRYVGLQLVGALLSNGVSPYTPSYTLDRMAYFNRVFSLIPHKRKELYESASEAAGMVLEYLSQVEGEVDGEVHDLVQAKLIVVHKEAAEKFITCLHRVALHHSQMVELFDSKVFFMLPKLQGDLRSLALDTLLQRASKLPDLFRQLRSKNFASFLDIRDEGLELICARLVRQVLLKSIAGDSPNDTHDVMFYLLPRMFDRLSRHNNPVCRQEVLDIASDVYDFELNLSADERNNEMLMKSKLVLIQLLNDSEEVVRNQVANFWSSRDRLPEEPCNKLQRILTLLYDPALDEESFLSSALTLILQSSSLSPDYELPIFQHPLSKCVFQEYAVDHSWRSRHAATSPMFVDSLHPAHSLAKQTQVVKATQQNLQFTETVAGGRNTYNWMTGNSMDTFASVPQGEEMGRNALLTSKRKPEQIKNLFALLKKRPTTVKTAAAAGQPTEPSSSVDVDVARLTRRFYKESTRSIHKYARLQEIKKKKVKQSRDNLKRRLEHEVQLHRKYREGELPDIEIPHRALVSPLAAACQHNSSFPGLFAPLLVSSLIEQRDEASQLVEDLLSILAKTKEKSSVLVGFVEEVCFRHLSSAQIPPSVISSASLAARKEELGIAVLEQLLVSNEECREPASKRRKTEKEPELDAWYELARLYKSLGYYDVIEGIMSEHGSSEVTSKGLKLEASGSFAEAKKVYETALSEEEGSEDVEKDLWEDCLMNCLKHLCSWKHVDQMCLDQLASFEDSSASTTLQNAWNYPIYVERYLPSALHSKLMLLLQGNVEAGNELASFIDDAMRGGEEKRELVEKSFSEHLCMLYVYQGDYDRAKYYLDLAMDSLSMKWTLSSRAEDRREELHLDMARLADAQLFLDTVKNIDNQSNELLMRWNNYDDIIIQSPLTSSFHQVMQRSFLLERLATRNSQLSSAANACKIAMRLRLMEVASLQNNFAAAKKLLSGLDEVYEQIESDDCLCVNLAHKTAVFYQALARYNTTVHGASQKNIKHLLAAHQNVIEQNDVINRLNDKETAGSHLLLLANTFRLMVPNAQYVTDDVMSEIDLNMPPEGGDTSVIVCLSNAAISHYEQACALVDGLEDGYRCKSKAYLELVEYCHRQLLDNQTSDRLHCATLLCQYVSRSMRIDGQAHSVASLKFPYLLQLLEEIPEVKDVFNQETATLPAWMFLAWVSHLVGLLDHEIAPSLHSIVWRLTCAYPQGVVYPFTTVFPSFKFDKQHHSEKQFVKKLKQKLQDEVPQACEFIQHLRFVADPALMLKDWIGDFSERLKSSSISLDAIHDYQNMYKDFFDMDDAELYAASDSGSSRLRSNFAKEYRKEVDGLFGGSTGNKISNKNRNQIQCGIGKLLEKLKKFRHDASTLKSFSPWLANYRPLLQGRKDLEVPGQYHGQSCPQLQYHVTIAGFEEKVQMMSSIRRPCRIGIRGSDEREHRFLIKGGEDLRQDQRIESMFACVNHLMSEDAECRNRSMRIETYEVIPISSKVGMLQWVDDVITYWEFVEKQARRMGCDDKLAVLRDTDWTAGLKHKNPVNRYGMLMQEKSYTDVVGRFEETSQVLPKYILRNGFLHMASSPESFVRLRKRFVASYAVMCVTHWLLGIGDRHTTNFMIMMKSGLAVGIDFGHAFGSATEILPVPELVPFRLTRQICGLLSPHDVRHGEMRQIMLRCLSTLRSRIHILLPILDVFIKDPSVDWMKFAKKTKDHNLGQDLSKIEWYSRRKVEIVERKLKGEHPAKITCDELEQNRFIGPYKKSYQSVAKGSKDDAYRRTVFDDGLIDVAMQVDCLIDQATDPNILGRTWIGWKSWC